MEIAKSFERTLQSRCLLLRMFIKKLMVIIMELHAEESVPIRNRGEEEKINYQGLFDIL